MKPTPRPWTCDDLANGDGPRIRGSDAYLADVYGEAGEANAAHIIKCVNMYDELVCVLESCQSRHPANPKYPPTELGNRIQRVLAKASEKK